MSLINEALKKAQRERDGGDAPAKKNIPTVGGAHPPPRANRGNPADKTSFKLVRALVVGGIVIAVLGASLNLLITAITKDPPKPEEQITEIPVSIKHVGGTTTAPTTTAAPTVANNDQTPSRAADRLATNATPMPVIEAPVITPPTQPAPTSSPATPPAPTPEPAPAAVAAAPTPTPATPAPAPITPAPVAPTPTPAPVAATPRPVAPTPVAPTPVAPTPVAPRPVAPTPVASTPAPAPAPVATPVAAAATPAPAPVVIPASPNPSPSDSVPAGPIIQELPQQPVTAGEPAKAPATPAASVAATNQQPDPKIIAFLEASRITGIKVAGSKSRVLMNNQVFKVGSIVEASSQLKITSIQPNEIQFVDESGVEYRKQFQR